MARHIRSGQQVIVTSGGSKGQTGVVKSVNPEKNTCVIEGVNIRKVHVKPTRANPQGTMIEREMPLHMSNVSPVVDGKPTRVRFQTKDDGSKVAVAARTDKELWTVRGAKARKSG
ncbi:MAG: 50S ribosomal protein L24 [Phycisphaerales bacterium JB043]